MDLRDITKNQHFLPQVEQRFNAIDPQIKSKNQKIYSFSIQDRNLNTVILDSRKGVGISKNLSLYDLFSFDILGKDVSRYNFESLFHDYECRVNINTKSLLSKLRIDNTNTKSEILNIFRFKVLNFIRNPYSIKKILNTFSEIKDIFPTDPVHYENFERVLNGNKPQKNYLCEQLGITENEYKEWLATIFILLNPMNEDPNFLDQLIKKVFENSDLFIQIHVYTYDNETCLLSDRGFNVYELNDNITVWEFNLCSHAFISYVFVDIDAYIPKNISKEIIDFYKSEPKSISVMNIHNDLTQLKYYNQRTIELCYKSVFNSSLRCYGVNVI